MKQDCRPEHHPQESSASHHHQNSDMPCPGGGRKLLKSRLKITLAASVALMVTEVIGGWISGSLSLIADSVHVFGDALAVGMVLLTTHLAERPITEQRSFGLYRLEILSALFNGFLLIFTTFFIFQSAYQRFLNPTFIEPHSMLVVSILGLAANFMMLIFLKDHSHQHLNMRSAYLHIAGDTLSSIAVVVSAAIVSMTGYSKIDVFASIFVGGLIIVLSLRLIYDSIHILLEGTPKHLSSSKVRSTLIEKFPEIVDIHDFHLWEITSHLTTMTAHLEVRLDSLQESEKLIQRMNEFLKKEFSIRHTTFQTETSHR